MHSKSARTRTRAAALASVRRQFQSSLEPQHLQMAGQRLHPRPAPTCPERPPDGRTACVLTCCWLAKAAPPGTSQIALHPFQKRKTTPAARKTPTCGQVGRTGVRRRGRAATPSEGVDAPWRPPPWGRVESRDARAESQERVSRPERIEGLSTNQQPTREKSERATCGRVPPPKSWAAGARRPPCPSPPQPSSPPWFGRRLHRCRRASRSRAHAPSWPGVFAQKAPEGVACVCAEFSFFFALALNSCQVGVGACAGGDASRGRRPVHARPLHPISLRGGAWGGALSTWALCASASL